MVCTKMFDLILYQAAEEWNINKSRFINFCHVNTLDK